MSKMLENHRSLLWPFCVSCFSLGERVSVIINDVIIVIYMSTTINLPVSTTTTTTWLMCHKSRHSGLNSAKDLIQAPLWLWSSLILINRDLTCCSCDRHDRDRSPLTHSAELAAFSLLCNALRMRSSTDSRRQSWACGAASQICLNHA